MIQELSQLEFVCEIYSSYNFTYRIGHDGASGHHFIAHYLNMWDEPHSGFLKNTLEGPKPYHN
jgi:hypothetical protein